MAGAMARFVTPQVFAERPRSRSPGVQYEDPDFPPNDRSLYTTHGYRTRHTGTVVWKRPRELASSPQFVVDGFSRHDIEQGGLGNCWFLAAAAVLASSHLDVFERVVPPGQNFDADYNGKFRFNFWWFGEWKEVVVDDYLPTDIHDRLIYCKNSKESNEFWPCLLEKAYAKLRGSYEALDGGTVQDAMVDMTGGISEVIKIEEHTHSSSIDLYSLLLTSHKMKTLMGASIKPLATDTYLEMKMSNGLVRGHAYSITNFKEVNTRYGYARLIRLRNPWAETEWNGPWSDRSFEIRNLQEYDRRAMEVEDAEDGEFWMSFEDFASNFSDIQLCHLEPDSHTNELADTRKKRIMSAQLQNIWHVCTYHSGWDSETAGGCGNPPYQDRFWSNPQFYVNLSSPDTIMGQGENCTLIVSLMQREKNRSRDICIGFKVFRVQDPTLRPIPGHPLPAHTLVHPGNVSGPFVNLREVTKRFQLRPGLHVIIPCTFNPHEEADFLLRIFTEKHVDSGVLTEVASLLSSRFGR